MGTHPIFESDFDCLTVKIPRLVNMGRGSSGAASYRRRSHKRFWGYCADYECAHAGRFISVRRTNQVCPKCGGTNIEEEIRASINGRCEARGCWMSVHERDFLQRFFPHEDARCGECKAQVFFVTRANGPGGPPGPYRAGVDINGPNHDCLITAYSGRAIAAPGEIGIGPRGHLANDLPSNIDYFVNDEYTA